MIFFALIAVFPFLSSEKPIAIINNTKVFEEDIPHNLTLDEYLQNLVFFELAKEKGYDDSVRTEIGQRYNQEIVRGAVGRFVRTGLEPTLYECLLFYLNSRKTLEVQIIQTESFPEALKAYIEVLRGEDFGSVSEKYTSNPVLKKSKGLLERPLSWSFVLPRTFSLLFDMNEGGVSVPLKYGRTWIIFKIISVKIEGDEDISDRDKIMEEITNPGLKRRVSQEKRSLYMFKLRELIPSVANVKINSKGLLLLGEKISSMIAAGKKIPFEEEDLDVVLASSTIGEYKVRNLIEDVALQGADLSFLSDKENTIRFIRDNVLNNTLVAMSRRVGAGRDPSLLEAYENNVKNSSVDFFKRKEVLAVIKESEDELKAFYDNNKDKYEIGERRRVSLVEVKEKKEAEEIRERLLKGENFGDYASKSIRKTAKKDGDIGYIEKNQWGAVGREAFLLRKGEISEVFKTEKGWAVIKVGDSKKSYLPLYSDVKSSVRIDYREYKAGEIANRIFDQNKEKFRVKVLN